MLRSFWTDNRVQRLVYLREEEGYSASEIATDLGDGCTRNAVIGKSTRLGLVAKKVGAKPKQRTKTAPKPRRKRAASNVPQIPRNRKPKRAKGKQALPEKRYNRALLDSAKIVGTETTLSIKLGQCRYAVSGEGEHTCLCGSPIAQRKAPYCVTHMDLCHTLEWRK